MQLGLFAHFGGEVVLVAAVGCTVMNVIERDVLTVQAPQKATISTWNFKSLPKP